MGNVSASQVNVCKVILSERSFIYHYLSYGIYFLLVADCLVDRYMKKRVYLSVEFPVIC